MGLEQIGFGDLYPGNANTLGELSVEDEKCNERFFGLGPQIVRTSRSSKHVSEAKVAVWLLARLSPQAPTIAV